MHLPLALHTTHFPGCSLVPSLQNLGFTLSGLTGFFYCSSLVLFFEYNLHLPFRLFHSRSLGHSPRPQPPTLVNTPARLPVSQKQDSDAASYLLGSLPTTQHPDLCSPSHPARSAPFSPLCLYKPHSIFILQMVPE